MRAVATLLFLCFLAFFAGLGRPALTDSDEAFYAEAGREMLELDDWLTPHFNYENRFEKPILFYWLVAVTYLTAGVSAAAARFPSALAGLGVVLLTFAVARRVYGDRAGFIAGAIAATSFGHFALARVSLPDLPLAFFLTLTIWAGLRGLDAAERHPRWLMVLAAASAALGFLTKGPIALVLPALVLVAAAFAGGIPRHIRLLDAAAAGIVFAAIALPWYLAMTSVHGTAYLSGFFIGDNIERFATTRFNEPRPIWFYGPVVLGGLFPWSPFLLLGIEPVWRRLRRPGVWSAVELRLVLWALVPLIFFTVSVGKQPRYILPVLPPLSILLGRAIDGHITRATTAGGRALMLRTAGVVSGVLIAVLGLLIERLRPLVLVDVSPTLITAGVAVLLISGAAVAVAALAVRPSALLAATIAGAALSIVAVHYGALSSAGPAAVERMAVMVKAHHDGTRPIGHQVFVRNLVFYTGIKQQLLADEAAVKEFLEDPRPGLCVVHQAVWERMGHARPASARSVGEVRYFNTAALRFGTLLEPDPAQELETVLLISNR